MAVVARVDDHDEGRVALMLRVEDLTKVYRSRTRGDVRALDGVSFGVAAGEVVGLLGPNGAGKSTTIRSICGLVRPTSGSVDVDGVDALADRRAAAARIAVLLEGNRNVLWRLTVTENLEFFAALHGLRARSVKARIDDLVDRFHLGDKASTPLMKLSRGMQQKVALACAVVPNTPLLLLDEPTLGLDIEISHELRHYLRGLADDERRAILLSSHDMDVIKDVCERVVVITGGTVVADAEIQELVEMFKVRAVRLRLADAPDPDLLAGLRTGFELRAADGPDPTRMDVALSDNDQLYVLMDHLRAAGAVIESIESAEPDLSEILLRLISERSPR